MTFLDYVRLLSGIACMLLALPMLPILLRVNDKIKSMFWVQCWCVVSCFIWFGMVFLSAWLVAPYWHEESQSLANPKHLLLRAVPHGH